jgi:plasmid stabilization system protein ParE
MTAKIVLNDDFLADVDEKTAWLVSEGREDQAARLLDELETVAKVLGHSPLAGPVEHDRDDQELRKLVLQKVPFVLWYSYTSRPSKVTMLRLFHVRQDRA